MSKDDIKIVVEQIKNGERNLGVTIDREKLIATLKGRQRLQPDLLLSRDGKNYLAEFKSWGGFGTGQFTLKTVEQYFLKEPIKLAYLLIRRVQEKDIHGHFLIASSRSDDHEEVVTTLKKVYDANVDIRYIDEILRQPYHPELKKQIETQLNYLDQAVVALKANFTDMS